MGEFTVMMLDELQGPFEDWLQARGLVMARVPDDPSLAYIVVPAPGPQLLPESESTRRPPHPWFYAGMLAMGAVIPLAVYTTVARWAVWALWFGGAFASLVGWWLRRPLPPVRKTEYGDHES